MDKITEVILITGIVFLATYSMHVNEKAVATMQAMNAQVQALIAT